MIRNALIAFTILAGVVWVSGVRAQVSNAAVVSTCGNQTYVAGYAYPVTVDTKGNTCSSSSGGTAPSPANYTTTQTGSTVTTHLTFQTALASNASRHGCTVTNTSADVEYVFFGANGSATTSNSIPVTAGSQVSCSDGSALGNDNESITSKTTDGASYVVTSR